MLNCITIHALTGAKMAYSILPHHSGYHAWLAAPCRAACRGVNGDITAARELRHASTVCCKKLMQAAPALSGIQLRSLSAALAMPCYARGSQLRGSAAGTHTYSLSSAPGSQWRHSRCGRLATSHLMGSARGIKVFVLLREHLLQPEPGTLEHCVPLIKHQGFK